jgi:hypothetical protein
MGSAYVTAKVGGHVTLRGRAQAKARQFYPWLTCDVAKVVALNKILGRPAVAVVQENGDPGNVAWLWSCDVTPFTRCQFCDTEKRPGKGARCPDKACDEHKRQEARW